MARKSRKQTAAPMPAPSLYVHVALYIRLSVEDNKKREPMQEFLGYTLTTDNAGLFLGVR